jgi:hypothetical protein
MSAQVPDSRPRSGFDYEHDPQPQRNVFIRSDQYSFIRKGVPSLMMAFGTKPSSQEEQIAKTWLTNRYHAPSGRPEPACGPESRRPVEPPDDDACRGGGQQPGAAEVEGR